jgi:hypothetical protein
MFSRQKAGLATELFAISTIVGSDSVLVEKNGKKAFVVQSTTSGGFVLTDHFSRASTYPNNMLELTRDVSLILK